MVQKLESKSKPKQDDGKGIIREVADAITKNNCFAVDSGGKLYHWQNGVYHCKAESVIKKLVKRYVRATHQDKSWKSALNREVIEFISIDCPSLWESPPIDVLNLKNGLLQLRDRKLLPHDPRHLSASQLPIEYNPKAKCPNIDKFVGQVFPQDCVALAFQLVGWLMLPITSIQKAILFFGEGGNGKSVWLNVLCQFLGKFNYSSLSLHKLESDRFAASRLIGKLANICPDLPNDALAGTSVFKTITGGDTLTAEYKFRDSFDFLPFSRLVFSSNSLPRSSDQSQGFFDRWIVVPFDRSFRGESHEIPRAELDAKLTSATELSGLLNKALDAIEEVKKRNWKLTTSPTLKRALIEFHSVTDPLGVWLDQFTVDDPDSIVPINILRAAYGAQCERKGNPIPTETGFGLSMKRHRPEVEKAKRTYREKIQWCYVGIGLNSDPLTASPTSQGSQGSQGFPLIIDLIHTPTNRETQKTFIEKGKVETSKPNLDYLDYPDYPETTENGKNPTFSNIEEANRRFLEAEEGVEF